MRTLRREGSPPTEGSFTRLEGAIDRLLSSLESGDQTLLKMTARPDGFVAAHVVNTAILALWLGLGKAWRRDRLLPLGLAALLHAWDEPRKLMRLSDSRPTADECLRLRLGYGRDQGPLLAALSAGSPAQARAAEILSAEKQGHPPRAAPYGDDTRLAAEFLRLCDGYDAMSHRRGRRRPLSAHEAVKTLVKLHDTQFDGRSLILFVSRLSLFPPGTCVRMSEGELAVVLEVFPDFPTRPTVISLVGEDGLTLENPKISVLKDRAMMNALLPADAGQAHIRDRRLAALLLTARWRPGRGGV